MLEITEQNLACQARNILKIKRLSKGQMQSLRRQILVQGTEQENNCKKSSRAISSNGGKCEIDFEEFKEFKRE